jgi:TolB-like protein
MGRSSVAVLGFDNLSRDSDDVYLAEGLTDEITARLGAIERLQVKSRNAVRRVQAAGAADPTALGAALGVRHLVEGSVRRSGSRVRVTVSLVNAGDGFRVWGDEYDRATTDLLSLQEDIAREVATMIAGRLLPRERATLAARPTRDALAYDLFLRANHFLARRSPQSAARAIAAYDSAVGRDPGFTQAQSRVALTYGLALWWGWRLGTLPRDSMLARGLAATDAILARDSAVADAWLARGFLLVFRHPRTLDGVTEAFRRAIALDSLNAEVWQQWGWVLQVMGDDSGGARAYRRAQGLDPDRAVAYSATAWYVALLGRRYREALALTDSALARDRAAYYVFPYRAQAWLAIGDTAMARADAITARRLAPPGYEWMAEGALAMVDAQGPAPARARARDTARRLESAVAASGQPSFVEASWLGALLAALGETERALALLERAKPHGAALWLELRMPAFDALRADPRFRRLVEDTRPPSAPAI